MRTLISNILCLFVAVGATNAENVSTVVDTEGDVFGYELRSEGSKELLFWAPSCYQPESTGSRDFCAKHTKAAEIKWNDDHSAVAITEANHRFIGEVLLLQQGPAANYENIFTNSLKQDIFGRTKLKWERCRFYFEGWNDRGTAALRLTGLHYTDEAKGLRDSATFRILLQLHNAKPLISVEPLPNNSEQNAASDGP